MPLCLRLRFYLARFAHPFLPSTPSIDRAPDDSSPIYFKSSSLSIYFDLFHPSHEFSTFDHSSTRGRRQFSPSTFNILCTMDCFQDFCLYCDRQSHEGPYCSQQCKLADLETSSSSSPSSPSSSSAPKPAQTWSSINHSTGYALPPAYSFPPKTPSYAAPTPLKPRQSRMTHFMWTPSLPQQQQTSTEPIPRTLTPSSSRSSLSSTTSSSSQTSPNGLSAQAKQDLHDYFSSFDQARAAKRRSSLR